MKRSGFLTAALALALTSSSALAQNWVTTWGAAALKDPISGNTGAMASQLQNIPAAGRTFRNVVHTTVGGSQVRVTISNVFGDGPLSLKDITVAVVTNTSTGAVNPNTINSVTFSQGQHQISIPAGSALVSDPVTMTVPQNGDFAVSFDVTQAPPTAFTDHDNGKGLNFYLDGDHASDPTIAGANTLTQWHFLTAMDVAASAGAGSIVIIGDSTSDGAGDGDDNGSNNRWPNFFYNQLVTNGHANLAVVDEGMGSDRVFTDGGLDAAQYPDSPNANNDELLRPSALHRFGRDVLMRSGIKYVIIYEGVNDEDAITRGVTCTAADLENAYQTMAQQAKQQDPNIKVYVATVSPLGNKQAEGSAPLTLHNQVNTWIRNNASLFDGIIDMDSALGTNVTTTDKYKAGDVSGDNLHPSQNGRHVEASTAAALTPFS